jgi:small conductance mechanosensitive channel
MSVGDVVDLGGHSGVIESMTIRSVRMRDSSGSVHTIPFSAVSTIVNMTKEYAYAVFNVGIAYESDVDRAGAALQEVGRALQQDPAFAPSILAPIEVLGIDSFGDLSIKLQARMKTRPGRQWAISREFNRRLMASFARAGIDMPHHPLPPAAPRKWVDEPEGEDGDRLEPAAHGFRPGRAARARRDPSPAQ